MGLSFRFKRGLQSPSKRVIRRKERNREKQQYSAKEIQTLVKAAHPHARAMILLGINCGFGRQDCCTLTAEYVDLRGGWRNYPSPKIEVERRCKLWPETLKALEALQFGPHVFNGRIWNRTVVAREFVKAMRDK